MPREFICPHCSEPHSGQPIRENDNWVQWSCPQEKQAHTTSERIEDLLTRDNKRSTDRLELIADICAVSADLPRYQLRTILERVIILCKEMS